jgi:hypothetical protein
LNALVVHTEQSIVEALMTARGDLFVAAAYLGAKPRELDSYIRASEQLQGFMAAIGHVKANPEYNRLSVEQFADELERLTRSYRLEALNIIHELATMNYDSAAMADVKLKAAIQLRGAAPEAVTTNTQGNILGELNRIYQEAAPRIKSIRAAVQIEME